MPASKYLPERGIRPIPTPTAQPALDSETATRLRAAIGRLSRRLRPTAAARAAGLTPTGISVLLNVDRRGPLRLSELGASEALNPTMLSRVVAGLGQQGLLERTSDERDRRAAWVQATRAGRRVADRMRRERTEAINSAIGALDERDRRLIDEALGALEALAEQLKEQRP